MSSLGVLAATDPGNAPILMLSVGGAFLAVAWTTVLLRVWVRTRMLKIWGWDDWMILVTVLIYTAEVAVLFSMAKIESKGHTSFSSAESFSELIVGEQALYIAGTISLKLSLAVFFLRFLLERWQRRVVLFSVGFYIIFATMAIFLVIFDCGVPTGLVLKNIRGQCVNYHIFYILAYIHGALNAATDWIFALLPIFVLWKSTMPRPTKISVCFIMLLAVAGSVVSCVRTAYVSSLSPSVNFYQSSKESLVWTVVEPGLGITAASLATLRPLFHTCLERTKTVFNSTRRLQTSDAHLPSSNKTSGNMASQQQDLEEMKEMAMPQSAWMPPKGMGEVHGLETMSSFQGCKSWDDLGEMESGQLSPWSEFGEKDTETIVKAGSTLNRVSIYELAA